MLAIKKTFSNYEVRLTVQNSSQYMIQCKLKQNGAPLLSQVLDVEINPNQIHDFDKLNLQNFKFVKKTVQQIRIQPNTTQSLKLSNQFLNGYSIALFVICSDTQNKEILMRLESYSLSSSQSQFGFRINKKLQIQKIQSSIAMRKRKFYQDKQTKLNQNPNILKLQRKKKLYKNNNNLPQNLNQPVKKFLNKTKDDKQKSLQIGLSWNGITDLDAQVFFQNGSQFSNLQILNMKMNQITSNGLKSLVINYEQLKKLKKICLSQNLITDEGLQILAQNGQKFPLLQEIQLNGNKIADKGFISLLDNWSRLPYLSVIALRDNNIGNKDLKSFSGKTCTFPNLKRILLSQNKINDQGMKTFSTNIKKFPNLISLDIDYNKISNQGMKTLFDNGEKFPLLRKVNLNNNLIGDEGIRFLVDFNFRLVNLQQFRIECNKITFKGFELLVQNQNKLIREEFKLYMRKNDGISLQEKKCYPLNKWEMDIQF